MVLGDPRRINGGSRLSAERVAEDKSLVWSGEHWIVYLRNHSSQADTGRMSLYRVAYSAAGDGHVAFVDIPAENFVGIYTDSIELARFMTKVLARGKSNNNFFPHDMQIFEAHVSRWGDVRTSPHWMIEADDGVVEASWGSIHPPLILEGPGPVRNDSAVTYSLLFFANEAALSFNGKSVGGVVYVSDEWIRAIGRRGTSAVFALAETTTTASSA